MGRILSGTVSQLGLAGQTLWVTAEGRSFQALATTNISSRNVAVLIDDNGRATVSDANAARPILTETRRFYQSKGKKQEKTSQTAWPCFVLCTETSPDGKRRHPDYARRFWIWDGSEVIEEIGIGGNNIFQEPLSIIEYRRSAYNATTGESTRVINRVGTVSPGQTQSHSTTDERGGYVRSYSFTYGTDGSLSWTVTNPNPAAPNASIGDQVNAFNCESYITLQYQCPHAADLLFAIDNPNTGNSSLTSSFLSSNENLLTNDGWLTDIWDFPANFVTLFVSNSFPTGSTQIDLKEYLSSIDTYVSPLTKLPIGHKFRLRYETTGAFSEIFTVIARSGDTYTITPPLSESIGQEYAPGGPLRKNVTTRLVSEIQPRNDSFSAIGSGPTRFLDPRTCIDGARNKTVAIGDFNPLFRLREEGSAPRTYNIRLRWFPKIAVTEFGSVQTLRKDGALSRAQCSRIKNRIFGFLSTPQSITIRSGATDAYYVNGDVVSPPKCANGKYWTFSPYTNPTSPSQKEASIVENGGIEYSSGYVKSPVDLSIPVDHVYSRPSSTMNSPVQPPLLKNMLTSSQKVEFLATGATFKKQIAIARIPWEEMTDDPDNVQLVFAAAVVTDS